MKIQTAPTQFFSELAMDTKRPIFHPSQQKSYIHFIIDAFSHFVVTVPIKSNNANTAVKILLHHWITNFGPRNYLVTDRGSEYMIWPNFVHSWEWDILLEQLILHGQIAL